jgi:hypothetical protein
MLQNLPLKKLVVELRYKADLGFYSKMDAVGVELADDFPDWERSPLTLEIRNKKKHRRLFTSVKRAFFDVDGGSPDSEFIFVEKLLRKVCAKLEVKQLSRSGIRQWFTADLGKPFALMVDEFSERFLPRGDYLKSILTDKTKDVGYVVDFETDEGLRYNLRMGPMLKSQWFSTVAHELNAFEQSEEESANTFANFQASFPEQFLFIDIDSYQEDQPADKLDRFLSSAHRRSHDLVSKLIEYCKK